MGQLMANGKTMWGTKVTTLKGTKVPLSCVQCFLDLVTSSINVSIFHSTWLDTFWTDLVCISLLWLTMDCLPLFLTSSAVFPLSKLKLVTCSLRITTKIGWGLRQGINCRKVLESYSPIASSLKWDLKINPVGLFSCIWNSLKNFETHGPWAIWCFQTILTWSWVGPGCWYFWAPAVIAMCCQGWELLTASYVPSIVVSSKGLMLGLQLSCSGLLTSPFPRHTLCLCCLEHFACLLHNELLILDVSDVSLIQRYCWPFKLGPVFWDMVCLHSISPLYLCNSCPHCSHSYSFPLELSQSELRTK